MLSRALPLWVSSRALPVGVHSGALIIATLSSLSKSLAEPKQSRRSRDADQTNFQTGESKMKARMILVMLLSTFALASPTLVASRGGVVAAAHLQVDLRGKRGVVDPNDLKKHDPKPPSLKTKEPPSPKVNDNKGDGPKSPPSDQGGDRGNGATGVRKPILTPVPKRPTAGPVPK